MQSRGIILNFPTGMRPGDISETEQSLTGFMFNSTSPFERHMNSRPTRITAPSTTLWSLSLFHIMDWIRNGDRLRKLLNLNSDDSGKLPGGELCFHLKSQGSLPLEDVHLIGLVSQGLKPENVLLDSDCDHKLPHRL
jgi:serine/threonine protein kinase